MRIKYIICILIFLISACKSTEYLLIEPVKGRIVSSSDKKPIGNVKIYVDKKAFNAFDTIRTNNDGGFFVDKLTINDYKDMHQQRNVSYSFVIEKSGFRKSVIDVRKFRKQETATLKDTIDLGLISLEALESYKKTATSKDWSGAYNASFLRMKEEYADPRGWGQINIEIGKKSAKFHLDSYKEEVKKDLKIVAVNSSEIQFIAVDNEKLKLTVLFDKGKYQLSGNLIEQIVGIKETYELKKKK